MQKHLNFPDEPAISPEARDLLTKLLQPQVFRSLFRYFSPHECVLKYALFCFPPFPFPFTIFSLLRVAVGHAVRLGQRGQGHQGPPVLQGPGVGHGPQQQTALCSRAGLADGHAIF